MGRFQMVCIVAGFVGWVCLTGCHSGGSRSAETPTRSPSVRPETPPQTPTATTLACEAGPTDSPTVRPTPTRTPAVSCERLSELAAGERPDFPPSIPDPMSCADGSGPSNYAIPEEELPSDASEELHVISVYEGVREKDGSPDERVPGVVHVVVHPRPKPIVLALNANDPVRWHITLEPGAELSRILALGNDDQSVEGVPAGVRVIEAAPCACTYGWEVQHNGDCSYGVVIGEIRELTGLHESSFQGCYRGDRFEVPYWTGDPPVEHPTPVPGDESIATRDVEFPGCETVTAESQYCLTTTRLTPYESSISIVGLDTGQVCGVTDTTIPWFGGSFAWRGELLYACTEYGLIRLSLLDGAWEALQIPCNWVASFDGGFILESGSFYPYGRRTLGAYRDHAALLNLSPYRTFDFEFSGYPIAVHGERFYAAYSGDRIDVADLGSNERVGVVGLAADENASISGMAISDDGQLILSLEDDSEEHGRLVWFDLQTGAQVRTLSPSERVFGLACTNRDPAPAGTPTPAPTPASPTLTGSPVPRPPSLPSCDILAATIYKRGQQANFAPSIPIEKNCSDGGGESSNYANPPDDRAATELHVISVYEGRTNPGFHPEPEGTVTVNVRSRPKPIVLLLASYEPTVWRLQLDPGVQLASVITQGNGIQSVVGTPAGVLIEHRAPDSHCGVAYGWEISTGESYPLFITDVRAYTGLVETSFQGCSSGGEFDVPYWNGSPPSSPPTPLPLDEDIPREAVEFPGCEEVTSQGHYCLTTTYDGPALIGLDTGDVCPLSSAPRLGDSGGVSLLAWRGEALYACTYYAGLLRISLRDGAIELAQVSCEGVIANDDRLLLQSNRYDWRSGIFGALYEYSSYEALLSGDETAVHIPELNASPMALRGSILYATSRSNTIDRFHLDAASPLCPIVLQDYEGSIRGMAVTDDGQLVLAGSASNSILVFDAETGSKLRELQSEVSVSGLSCVTRD